MCFTCYVCADIIFIVKRSVPAKDMAYGALLPAASLGEGPTTNDVAAVCLCLLTVMVTIAGIIWTLPSRSYGATLIKFWEALVVSSASPYKALMHRNSNGCSVAGHVSISSRADIATADLKRKLRALLPHGHAPMRPAGGQAGRPAAALRLQDLPGKCRDIAAAAPCSRHMFAHTHAAMVLATLRWYATVVLDRDASRV